MSKFLKTAKVQSFFRKLSTQAVSKTETISVPAGAAGTVKNFYLTAGPVANSNGNDLGGFGDSSLSFATGVFDVEVAPQTTDANLSNGEYWIDYLTGMGRGKKKTTGTSESVTYKYFVKTDSNDITKTVSQGSKDVTTAGTAEALVGSSTVAKWVTIQVNINNTGNYGYIGDSSVASTNTPAIPKGSSITIPHSVDLNTIYVDVGTNGDGFTFIYVT